MSGAISTKGRYALRVMVDIGCHDGWVPVTDIAQRQGITRKNMEQVMASLVKANFVVSQRGKGGGYQLAKEPSAYTVGAILRAADQAPLSPVGCLECSSDSLCPRADACPTLPLWRGLGQVTSAYLDSKTLADLIASCEDEPRAEASCSG